MGETFNPRDYRLYRAVKSHSHYYVDGMVRVECRNGHLSVFFYDKRVFHLSLSTGFFEATTYGENHRWLRDKMNACLAGANIKCRLFTNEFGKLVGTTLEGREFSAYKFNSKVLEV